MSRRPPASARPPSPVGGLAAAIVDARGRLVSWTDSAAALLGHAGRDGANGGGRGLGPSGPGRQDCGPLGQAARDLLAPRRSGPRTQPGVSAPGGRYLHLRHHDGGTVDVWVHSTPLAGGETLLVGFDTDEMLLWSEESAAGRSLLEQDTWYTSVQDLDLRVRWSSLAAERTRELLPDGRDPVCLMRQMEGAGTGEDLLRRVLDTGRPVMAAVVSGAMRPQGEERFFALTAMRLDDFDGRPSGVAMTLVDVTGRLRSDRRLELVLRASQAVGRELDVQSTAEALVDVLVPAMGDMATVEVLEGIDEGAEPTSSMPGTEGEISGTRRLAARNSHGRWPEDLVQVGEATPVVSYHPDFEYLLRGEAVFANSLADHAALVGSDPSMLRLTPKGLRGGLGAALLARGNLIGHVQVYRTKSTLPFDEEDAKVLVEIVTRAALSMDNARRYIRERRMVVTLQQSLLPPLTASTASAETAGVYLPAEGTASVGGDWFDALPLPSLRTAFVLGDVIGHGLNATALMARVRTAVQTLAELDLQPDELLARLDDLVLRIAAEAEHADTMGASCLYAVYDPVTGLCRLSSAGHPSPAVVRPDGAVRRVEVEPGPKLGVGGMPFESVELVLEPGSVLVLYSDALPEYLHPASRQGAGTDTPALAELDLQPDGADRGAEAGEDSADPVLDRLRSAAATTGSVEEIGEMLVAPVRRTAERQDDVTVLLARVRRLDEQSTATWEFPAEAQAVSRAREAVLGKLEEWGLESLAFSTELVVSELFTNVIRYAEGPVGLRLTRDAVLVCEVSDTSNSQPRLRHARATDEGGRGLFLVAQVTKRWGSRYGDSGKTIWTEQDISPPGKPDGGLPGFAGLDLGGLGLDGLGPDGLGPDGDADGM